jgi:hypothetical protein
MFKLRVAPLSVPSSGKRNVEQTWTGAILIFVASVS